MIRSLPGNLQLQKKILLLELRASFIAYPQIFPRELFFHVCVSAAFIIAGTLYIFHREIMDTSNVDGSLLKKNDLHYEKYLTPRYFSATKSNIAFI
jgi:hypothetical protein